MDREDFKKMIKAWIEEHDKGTPHRRLGIPPMIKGKDVDDAKLALEQTLSQFKFGKN